MKRSDWGMECAVHTMSLPEEGLKAQNIPAQRQRLGKKNPPNPNMRPERAIELCP